MFFLFFFWQQTDEAIENLRPDVEGILSEGEKLLDETKDVDEHLALELEADLRMLRTHWRKLEEDADRRKTVLKTVVPQWQQFEKDALELKEWIDEMEKRLNDGKDDATVIEVRRTVSDVGILLQKLIDIDRREIGGVLMVR